MEAAAQEVGLEAGLAVQGDDPPLGTEPRADQSFSTMPTRLFGMYRTPESTTSEACPDHEHDQGIDRPGRRERLPEEEHPAQPHERQHVNPL